MGCDPNEKYIVNDVLFVFVTLRTLVLVGSGCKVVRASHTLLEK